MKNSDVSEHLRQEEEWLAHLKENLEKSRQLKTSMSGILDLFVERVESLEGTVLPLYEHTAMLQRRQQNITKAMKVMDDTLSYYSVANEVEHTIQTTRPIDLLDTYIERMERLKHAIQFFTGDAQAKKGGQLERVTAMYEFGCGSLEKDFGHLLQKGNRPVKPVDLGECVSEGYEPIFDKNDKLTLLDAGSVVQLAKIAKWLTANAKGVDLAKIYGEVRATCLLRCLKDFHESRKAASGGTSQSAGQPPRKDTVSGRVGGMVRKGIRSYASDATHRRQTMAVESVTEFLYENEAETLLLLFAAFLVLLQYESAYLAEIFTGNQVSTAQHILMQTPFDYVIDQGMVLSQLVGRSLTKHEYSAVFCLFPVVQYLQAHDQEFKRLFSAASGNRPYVRYQELTRAMDSLCVKALEDFVESVKSDPEKFVPRDGTVHQLTSNALVFLGQLMDYRDSLEAVLPTTDLPKLAVPKYFARVLSALGLSLRNKGEMYTDATLKAVFLLNNYNHILRSLHRSGALKIVSEQNKEVGGYYDQQIKEHKAQYLQCWNKLLSVLVDPRGGPMRGSPMLGNRSKDGKDRQHVKDSFATFNKELETQTYTQRGFSVANAELANDLIRESKELILPKYKAFHSAWSNTEFSKNPQKYLKYTPTDVNNMLDHLFDAK